MCRPFCLYRSPLPSLSLKYFRLLVVHAVLLGHLLPRFRGVHVQARQLQEATAAQPGEMDCAAAIAPVTEEETGTADSGSSAGLRQRAGFLTG